MSRPSHIKSSKEPISFQDEASHTIKNDHLGFDILYIHAGVVHKYRPDYVIRLTNGIHLILEVKGQPTQQDRSKEIALNDWVTAINNDKRFGKWAHATSTHPKDIPYIIQNGFQDKTSGV